MKVNICGRRYTIKKAAIPDHYGLCDPATATITINNTLQDESTIPEDVIMLHEIIHAILYETGMTNLLPERHEEGLVHCLAIQLHNVGYRKS